jgi:hypothetical protein
MATVAAGPVFRLLGAKDLGVTEDYHIAKMPPVNAGLLDGQLAWSQHDGGHTDAPNWKYFIPWADKFLNYHAALWELPADQPVFRTEPNSLIAHAQSPSAQLKAIKTPASPDQSPRAVIGGMCRTKRSSRKPDSQIRRVPRCDSEPALQQITKTSRRAFGRLIRNST